MNNLYLSIFRQLLNYHDFIEYYEYLDKDFLKNEYPEYYKIYKAIGSLIKEDKEYSVDDLEIAFYGLYPSSKPEMVQPLLESIRAKSLLDTNTIKGFLQKIKKASLAQQLAEIYIKISSEPDKIEYETERVRLQGLLDRLVENAGSPDELEESVVDVSFSKVVEKQKTVGGLRWRLQSLNDSLGALLPGDFGIIFARPETGKTTFLASEIPALLQSGGDIGCTWFNNEERSDKVIGRIYQGTLGKKYTELLSNPRQTEKEFNDYFNGRVPISFVDNSELLCRAVENRIARTRPRLVVFDQLDKIGGFTADRKDLEHKARYIWARALAKKYNCTVIGLCQASVSGENKKWLTPEDMDESKTGKAAEADFILGIGKVDDIGKEKVRYFHLSKNKTNQPIDEEKRHGKWAVKINPEIARYEDF